MRILIFSNTNFEAQLGLLFVLFISSCQISDFYGRHGRARPFRSRLGTAVILRVTLASLLFENQNNHPFCGFPARSSDATTKDKFVNRRVFGY